MKDGNRILITALGWGLGHATRCIPIIRALQARGYTPLLASDSGAYLLLKKEFSSLKIFELPSYNIRYGSHNMIWNMAWQLPKIQRAIFLEHRAIQKIVESENVNIILSDNRYGCWHKATRNIFITHQLNIKIPNRVLEKIIAKINHQMIARFDECWIPDFSSNPTLAGDLSKANKMKNVRYIGSLSRMKIWKANPLYDLIIVLSGPEPQRTYLEEKILKQVHSIDKKILLVRGLTNLSDAPVTEGKLTILPYLTTQDLNEAILASEVVICRSGYSSVMDLVALRKPAILIPTPGQTEQEYLAKRLEEQGVFLKQKQSELDLENGIKRVKKYSGFTSEYCGNHLLNQAIDELLSDQ